ncbi:hypothetical protein ACQ5SO_14800 [Rhodovulum sp. DZ06]|uniref:hypothetical protein n=1 Tax=Rhodovulum sp. DZ06 TaxID=3425126 RepID=UPI003D339CA9
MAGDEVETVTHEVGARVLAGDFAGYMKLVVTPLVRVGQAETGIHADAAAQRRVFERTSLRARHAGWDGLSFEMLGSVAIGGSSIFARFRMTPTIDGVATPLGRTEGGLFQRIGERLMLRARLNTTGGGYESDSAYRPEREPVPVETAALTDAVRGLQQGLQQGDIARFLSSICLPMSLNYDDGVTPVRNAGDAVQVLAAYRQMNTEIASYDSELIDVMCCGPLLRAARFRIFTRLRDGGELDPFTNLYFLRRGRDGWRVALAFNAAIGRTLPPPPPLGRTIQ